MRTLRKAILITAGMMVMLSLFGCGGTKYKLNFNSSGFETKKTQYPEGANVTVYYGMIATDTDYRFWIDDDVKMKQDYDNDHGYIFTFKMPGHDVTMGVESYNSMEYFDGSDGMSQEEIAAQMDEENMYFDYYTATVATVGGDGHDELVLYDRIGASGLVLASYSQWGEGEEVRKLCIVPESVLTECMAAVGSYKMREWKDGIGITGEMYVVKFKDGDNIIRVSSDDMPEDGMKAFNEIGSILNSAWDNYKTDEQIQED